MTCDLDNPEVGDIKIVVHCLDSDGANQEWQACVEKFTQTLARTDWVVQHKFTGSTEESAVARADEYLSNMRASRAAAQSAIDKIESTRKELAR